MDNLKDDRYYAKKILYYVEAALSCSKRVDFSQPEANQEGIFAINFCLIQIREYAENLSPSFLENKFPVSLTDLAMLRNTLTHDYGNVDFSIYKHVVQDDLPKIKKALLKYLK
jgi:uncharacterized protein with HEPN domain